MPKRTDLTYIETSSILSIVNEAGLKTEEKAGWIKVFADDDKRFYIPRGNAACRIDIAGFLAVDDIANDLGGASRGSVKQELKFTGSTDEVLSRIRKLCEQIKVLPAVTKSPKRGALTPVIAQPSEKKEEPLGTVVTHRGGFVGLSDEERAARLALIRKVANEKGVAISKKTLDELER